MSLIRDPKRPGVLRHRRRSLREIIEARRSRHRRRRDPVEAVRELGRERLP